MNGLLALPAASGRAPAGSNVQLSVKERREYIEGSEMVIHDHGSWESRQVGIASSRDLSRGEIPL